MLTLIDVSQVLRANYFIAKKIIGDDLKPIKPEMFIELVDKNLNNILFELLNKAKTVILCCDTKSFRYKVYSEYKSGRHDDLVFRELESIYFDTTIYDYLRIDGLEADDLLYLLSNGNSIIVSNDHDLKLANSLLFSPTSKRFLPSEKPNPYELIIKGCGSDTIPKLVPRFSKSMLKNLPDYDSIDLEELVDSISLVINVDPKDVLRNIELVLYREDTYLKYVPNQYNKCLDYQSTLSI